MKLTIMILAALSIGAVMVIATMQLIKTLIQEMADIVAEAWHSAESH